MNIGNFLQLKRLPYKQNKTFQCDAAETSFSLEVSQYVLRKEHKRNKKGKLKKDQEVLISGIICNVLDC